MRLRRSGFTTRASCLFAAGLTAIVCGLILGEINLLRAGIFAAVTPWIASYAVSRARIRIGATRAVSPARVIAGQSVTASLTITNGSSLRTTTLMLEDRLPEQLSGHARFVLAPLRNRESRTVSYRIPRLPRGRYRIGPLQIRLTDPFGLVEVTRSFTATSEFVTAPAIERLGPADLPRTDDRGGSGSSHSIGSQGAEDASTRQYRIGDDLRKIHWRSTARTGSMMVRQEERPWQGQAAVLLDLRAAAHTLLPDDPPELDPRLLASLEWAVSAAASIGASTLNSGQRFTLATDPRQRRAVRFDTQDALLGHLADALPQRTGTLDPLLTQLRGSAETTSTMAVLGRVDHASLARLTAGAPHGQEHAPAALVLDVETWRLPLEDSGAEPPPPPEGFLPAAAAAAALLNAGWRAVVVPRGDSVAGAWHALLGRSGAIR